MAGFIQSGRFAASGPTISDSFNRADNASSLGTADTGQAWTAHSGTWGISSNRAKGGGGGALASIGTTTSDDMTVQSTLYFGSGGFMGLLARCNAGATVHYLAQATASVTQIYKYNGGYTLLTSNATGWADGDVCLFSVIGTALTVKKNGTTVLSTTDSAITTGTRAGLRDGNGNTAMRWEDFSAT